MDKLAIVRSMHTKGNDHPQGTHYAITAHEPNPAMHFPVSVRSSRRRHGSRNGIPPNVLTPQWENGRQYEEYFRSGFLGAGLRSDVHSRSQQEGFPRRRSQPAQVGFRAGRAQPPEHFCRWWISITATLYTGAEHAEHGRLHGRRPGRWCSIRPCGRRSI